jgi:broad specificity phosphatase PhoE
MKVFVIRHGEKDSIYLWNDTLGIKDNLLNEKGNEESKELATYFSNTNICRVYVSEYERTKETIMPYCRIKNIEPIVTKLINEIDMGEFNLIQNEREHERYFIKWDRYQKDRKDFKYKGGESGKQALKRVKKFFEIIEDEESDAIIVTHEGWIKLAICYILGIRAGKRFCLGNIKTCSITEIEYETAIGKWKINSINWKLEKT